MHTVESALEAVLAECRRYPAVEVPLAAANGRVLDEEVVADLDMPPFDKALVDGYAVRAGDLTGDGPWTLEVVDEIDAGSTPRGAVGAGRAALVMTGAPLPEGADAVVMLEESARDGAVVRLTGSVRSGQNRLEQGREYRRGEVLLRPGEVLNAPSVGLLAATGHPTVRVVDRPLVGVVATGDELVDPAAIPGPGQIRNSNGAMLTALIGGLWNGAVALPPLPDRQAVLRESFGRLLGAEGGPGSFRPDVLVVSGGVSAGRRDLVPAALEAAGVRPVLHKVKVKPGKPLWYGVGPERGERPPVLVFGLPGNPVSGIVSVLLFVAPALAALEGRRAGPARVERVRLAAGYAHRGPRATYHPARRVEGEPGRVETLAWAGSADLRTVALADGFAVFPAGDRDYGAGDEVEFLPLPSTP
jgi:molybdopterin molybdotransferase